MKINYTKNISELLNEKFNTEKDKREKIEGGWILKNINFQESKGMTFKNERIHWISTGMNYNWYKTHHHKF